MKQIFLFLAALLVVSLAYGQAESLTQTPLEVVNQRMEAYNQHNFKAFIKLYADDVQIYTYPDKLLGEGIDHMTWIFKPKFEAASISVEIVNQMFNGNYVINHEIVTENGKQTKYISIYEVADGLIQSVKFVRDH